MERCRDVELAIHARLPAVRTDPRREFFRIDADDARRIIDGMLEAEATVSRARVVNRARGYNESWRVLQNPNHLNPHEHDRRVYPIEQGARVFVRSGADVLHGFFEGVDGVGRLLVRVGSSKLEWYDEREGGVVPREVGIATIFVAALHVLILDAYREPPVSNELTGTPMPKCFISYSHDSEGHIAWVEQLARTLESRDIEVVLDTWYVSLGTHLPRFMSESVRTSDNVIIVGTPEYARKVNGNSGGAAFEGSLISVELFLNPEMENKFIPLLRDGDDVTAFPSFMQGRLYVDARKGNIDHVVDEVAASISKQQNPRSGTKHQGKQLSAIIKVSNAGITSSDEEIEYVVAVADAAQRQQRRFSIEVQSEALEKVKTELSTLDGADVRSKIRALELESDIEEARQKCEEIKRSLVRLLGPTPLRRSLKPEVRQRSLVTIKRIVRGIMTGEWYDHKGEEWGFDAYPSKQPRIPLGARFYLSGQQKDDLLKRINLPFEALMLPGAADVWQLPEDVVSDQVVPRVLAKVLDVEREEGVNALGEEILDLSSWWVGLA